MTAFTRARDTSSGLFVWPCRYLPTCVSDSAGKTKAYLWLLIRSSWFTLVSRDAARPARHASLTFHHDLLSLTAPFRPIHLPAFLHSCHCVALNAHYCRQRAELECAEHISINLSFLPHVRSPTEPYHCSCFTLCKRD